MKITIYSKSFVRKGWMGDPISVKLTLGFNTVGSAEVVFRADHPQAANILAPGARMTFEAPDLDGVLMSGPVTARSGAGPTKQAVWTVTVEDDLRLLWRVLGWPVPGAALTAQSSGYRTYTGSAETVVKTAITENAVTRLGLPVTVAPNLFRGASTPIKYRMHPLAERMFPAIEQAGLGVRVVQDGPGLLVDVYQQQTFPRTLSEEAGTVVGWSWNSSNPTATRVIGGGEGEGVARLFRSVTSTALEAEYGDVVEVFNDGRSSENTGELDAANLETLTEGKPKAGFNLSLSETKHFRFGDVNVGDIVTVKAGGLTHTDVLRTVEFSWTREDGFVITPAVGEIADSQDAKTFRAIKKLWSGLTNLKVR